MGSQSSNARAGAATPLDLVRPAVLQRQPDEDGSAPLAAAATDALPSAASAANVSEAAPAAAKPNIDALAQLVYQQLRRRLLVDRERLGRW
jgi:hypothetical protein